MTSWMTPGGSFNEADEDDEASAEVAEEIKAVDQELKKLQFEMQMEKSAKINTEKSR